MLPWVLCAHWKSREQSSLEAPRNHISSKKPHKQAEASCYYSISRGTTIPRAHLTGTWTASWALGLSLALVTWWDAKNMCHPTHQSKNKATANTISNLLFSLSLSHDYSEFFCRICKVLKRIWILGLWVLPAQNSFPTWFYIVAACQPA